LFVVIAGPLGLFTPLFWLAVDALAGVN